MAIRSIRSGGTQMTETSLLQLITDLVKSSGITDIVNGTQFKVTAGSGLSVNVATGNAYLKAASGNCYPINSDAQINNLAINSNSSGNPRISTVVLYKDLGTSPNADDSNTNHVIIVDGTPAASPNPPSPTTVQTAVGAGNPYIQLANLVINSGATTPTQIIDIRSAVTFRSDIINSDPWVVINNATGTVTLDLSQGKKFWITATGNITFQLLNVPLTQKSIAVRVTQDPTGGRTLGWWSGLYWPNGITPTSPMNPNKADEYVVNFLTIIADNNNVSEGFVVGNNI